MSRRISRPRALELHLVVDRDTASRLGITAQVLDDTLYDAFGQRIVSTTFTQLNQYRDHPRGPPRGSRDRSTRSIGSTSAPRPATPVPLSHVRARSRPGRAALAIDHEGQFPSVTLSFNTAPGVSLGDAVAAIDEAIGAARAAAGDARRSSAAPRRCSASRWRREPILILAALITVYIVLGVLYESYIHPITILSTLPSAGVGAILALDLTGKPFDVISLIGIVLLIGIVKKNAIMMIDFALEAEREQKHVAGASRSTRPACCGSGRS